MSDSTGESRSGLVKVFSDGAHVRMEFHPPLPNEQREPLERFVSPEVQGDDISPEERVTVQILGAEAIEGILYDRNEQTAETVMYFAKLLTAFTLDGYHHDPILHHTDSITE